MDVELTIISLTQGSRTEQKARAALYEREDRLFYRYQEPESDMGKVTTILKVEPSGIRLLRQGDIRSEQQFSPGKRLPGFYDTAYGRLELDTVTHGIRQELEGGLGRLSWSYDLYVSGERTGFYELSIEATPCLS